GVFEKLLEIGIRDAASHERAHHPEGQLVIRQASPGRNLFLGEARQGFRYIETAAAGQASDRYSYEIQRRRLSVGTDTARSAKHRFELQASSFKLQDNTRALSCSLRLVAYSCC